MCVQGQPGLSNKFQGSQDYTEGAHLKAKQNEIYQVNNVPEMRNLEGLKQYLGGVGVCKDLLFLSLKFIVQFLPFSNTSIHL